MLNYQRVCVLWVYNIYRKIMGKWWENGDLIGI